MARSFFKAAVLLVVAGGLVGCTGARYVQRDQNSGVVAIPDGSDVFPTYYRSKAIDLIKENNPTFNPMTDIVSQGEVVVGKQTRNDERIDQRKIGPDGKPIGDVTTKTDVTTTKNETEWRIQYKIAARPMSTTPGSNGVIQAGAMQRPGQPVMPNAQQPDSRMSITPTQPGLQGPSMNYNR